VCLLRQFVQGDYGYRPTGIVVDFELGSINALRRRWPDAQISGCLFHLGKSIYRHIEKLPAVDARYCNDEEYKLSLKRLQALSFVEPRDVIAYFETLKRDFPDDATPVAGTLNTLRINLLSTLNATL